MSKKKNYVYRVCSTNEIYGNLNTAVAYALKDLNAYLICTHTERATKPFVSKIDGGYLVIVIDIHGRILKRRIDVFEPILNTKKPCRYILDQCNKKIKDEWDDFEY